MTNRDVVALINNHVYTNAFIRIYMYHNIHFSLCVCYPSISTYGLHALTDYWTFTGIPIALASPRNDIPLEYSPFFLDQN